MCLILGLASPARGAGYEDSVRFLVLVRGGAAIPVGEVSGLPDGPEFPSRSSSNVYDVSPAFGVAFGLHFNRGYITTVFDFDAVIWSTTAWADSIASAQGAPEPRVLQLSGFGFEYGTYIGQQSWFAPFGAFSIRFLGVDGSREGDSDAGLGLSVSAGVDFVSRTQEEAGDLLYRVEVRYQPLSPWTDTPSFVSVYAAVGGRLSLLY